MDSLIREGKELLAIMPTANWDYLGKDLLDDTLYDETKTLLDTLCQSDLSIAGVDALLIELSDQYRMHAALGLIIMHSMILSKHVIERAKRQMEG